MVDTSFLACAVVSAGFGVLGYLLFGAATKQIVILNVQGSMLVACVTNATTASAVVNWAGAFSLARCKAIARGVGCSKMSVGDKATLVKLRNWLFIIHLQQQN